jgi:hypothetical protein
VDALGSSGSIAAHRALVAMLKRGKQEPVLLKVAAIALSRTQRPSAASIEGLSALLDAPGLATQATYGLGTTIRRLREGHQEERAAPLVKLLVERLNTTTDPVQQVTLLRAIANSGHPAAFPSVAPLLSVSNPEIRAAALEALQLMAHPEVDAILARAATEDPAQNVRAAATRAARLRRPLPALREPITRTARSDANPHVRLSALHTLTTWLSIDPTLEPVIRDIATHEREQPIRVAATNALTRLTSQ